ncbi:two-component system response regulator [Seohaeicola zhoushanensis]
MVIAHIFIGTFIGMMSFVVAMVQGASFWTGLGAYCVVGAGTTILMGTVQYLLTRGKAETASHTVEVVTAPPAPVAEVAPPPPVQPETVAETMEETGDEAVRSMKVLAVDDDPFILELVPKIAAMVGCEDITVAHSGPEALEIIANAEEPFDCLLLDINMPEMDGIELCARVRKLEDYQDTSIIMLTAMSDLDHLDRAFRAGASDYTTKPFDIIEFGDRLKTAQSRSSDNWTRAHEAEAAQAEGEGVDDWGSARLARLASVPAIIGYSALQNYLTRLSGPALEEAFVMAISVDRAAGPRTMPTRRCRCAR